MADVDEIALDGNLPGDVMVSILTYLPVKSLMKFKAVSKPWCSFISSSRFYKIHLHHQSVVSADNCLVVLTAPSAYDDRRFGILNLTLDDPFDHDILMFEGPPILSLKPYHFGVTDSCNGLVCMYSLLDGSSAIVLWNPATRKCRFIDLPKGDVDLIFRTLGFCYVDATNDFKILGWNHSHLPSTVDKPYLYVYSLSSDSWEKFDFYAPKTDIYFHPPTFMGRCMHWLSHTCTNGFRCTCSSGIDIVAFDVMDGTMSWFHTPSLTCGRQFTCGSHCTCVSSRHTLAIGGCLSIVIVHDSDDVDAQERGFEVWGMEEYGVEGSWVKRFFVRDRDFILPFISWNYGKIIYACVTDDIFRIQVIYDPYTKKKKYLEFCSSNVLNLFKYVESLASVETSLGGT